MIFAPKFPLNFDSSCGYENIEGPKKLILFHLKNLLFTFPGEKISDPEYGVGISRLLFEQSTPGFLNNVADDISDAISKYLGYLNLRFVTVEPLDDAGMQIKIAYFVPNLKLDEVATIDLSVNEVI